MKGKDSEQEQLYKAVLDLGLKGTLPYKLKESSLKFTMNHKNLNH